MIKGKYVTVIYGARGDGRTDDSSAIQKALDAAAPRGGTVVIPTGKTFLFKAINITGNLTELRIDGALRISDDYAHWPAAAKAAITIPAKSNIAITGSGTIDGQGATWWANLRNQPRPRTIYPCNVDTVIVSGITVKDCPYHCLQMYSSNTEIFAVTLRALPSTGIAKPSHNIDGINIHGDIFWDTLQEFRNIFTTHLRRNSPLLAESDLRQSLLYPTPELIAAHDFRELSAVDAAFERVRPSVCKRVEGGLRVVNGPDPLAPLAARRAAGKAPVTIVSLNGMAGEFVPRPALSIAYNASSTFAVAYRRMLAEHPGLTVPVWDNRVLADVKVPLGEIVTAGSMDAADGTPLYNVVFFTQREMSLESLIHPDFVVPRLIQRMTLFLDLVGRYVDDFVLIGFSRGSIDAVNIMARQAEIPWGKRIRGIITLDGVVFGTSLADCGLGEARSDPPSMCEIISDVMVDFRKLYENLVPKVTHVIQNTARLTAISAKITLAFSRLGRPQTLKDSHLLYPDVLKSYQELIDSVLFGFDVTHPVINYDENIQRLKNLLGGILTSMRLLSTKTRTEWWATHTLPADRLYASVTGTLDDASYSAPEVHPDEWAMRYLYYVVAGTSGQELVDGPVQTSRQMFLPEVHRGLNPSQTPYTAHWLGLFHTTHAGTVLDYAVPCPDKWVDPFPRKTLVDSFATWIATHSK
eukprot:m51a1_g5232 putative polygalacturonase (695) ;mRNA; f:293197-298781